MPAAANRSVQQIARYRVDSIGRRYTVQESEGFDDQVWRPAVGEEQTQAGPFAGTATGGRREDRGQFWAAIARGLYPEAAVAEARVPWVVGTRWFRQASRMPPTHLSASPHQYRVVICHLPSVNRMPRRVGAISATRQQRRGGAQIARPAVRSARSWRSWAAAPVCAGALAGVIATPTGETVHAPAVAWTARKRGRRQHRR